MKYKEETILRGGETILLRSLCAQDAASAIAVGRRAAGETPYMMRYPDEWRITEEREAAIIKDAQDDPHQLMLGAFVGERLVGLCHLQKAHPGDKARHRAGLGVCILQAYCGRGIGTAMLRAVIGAARATALEQIELDVVEGNAAALRLYARCGFEEYGRHPRMMKLRDGTYRDMILMMLRLR